MESATAFSPSKYFPPRRRVQQACLSCSARKSRCDGARPECGTCARLNKAADAASASGATGRAGGAAGGGAGARVQCVYRESQTPRIEYNTQVLLERIQLLEDRILGSGSAVVGNGGSSGAVDRQHGTDQLPRRDFEVRTSPSLEGRADGSQEQQPPPQYDDIQVSLSHTANSNHVYEWPVVKQLLGTVADRADATDVFFTQPGLTHSTNYETPPMSWRLFSPELAPHHAAQINEYRELVRTYFSEVNLFFPVLSPEEVLNSLDQVAMEETGGGGQLRTHVGAVPGDVYARLLLVLCFAAFVTTSKHLVTLRDTVVGDGHKSGFEDLAGELWNKARLLLGWISPRLTLEAAQCSMIASLYCGARGDIAESYHYSQATAVKCEALAKRYLLDNKSNDHFCDAFRRLYWVAFIYEGDFSSEISITLPSGIAKFEDNVPYPIFSTPDADASAGLSPRQAVLHDGYSHEPSIIAFQISTNASIRRFLNRVNSVVYDSKEQYRMARPDYADWLLRVTNDLWSHHSAVYRNLPAFLLTSSDTVNKLPLGVSPANGASPSTPGFIRSTEMGNNPWNVIRLKGRYYAGQYIIHRPFMEFVLRNLETVNSHPSREAMLEKCRLCFDGCAGFIWVFDVDPANSVTCLFASGMVHFTMVIILRVAAIIPAFRRHLPADVEEAIFLGRQNLRRFATSVKHFEWHLSVLERLEQNKSAYSNGG
ncbi:uncharacterized protein B0I36DRAFT_368479 [Microdochium trichocladiopsis]|uniref:Zn(2)-C6 fungal-type domain-containing protein n=1 Tax=Microdochium trichocladiopsis TaxID=1682393 RepID=A0A9P8XV49_9PEZI|nr:uncharacterized protein B0I36DRAFT_368479 [Microdochium trichocladiopsis]KAH7018460.1 hypothetical protein B0I36DRAFT_368479 [Microdochium trichocladiopsis]